MARRNALAITISPFRSRHCDLAIADTVVNRDYRGLSQTLPRVIRFRHDRFVSTYRSPRASDNPPVPIKLGTREWARVTTRDEVGETRHKRNQRNRAREWSKLADGIYSRKVDDPVGKWPRRSARRNAVPRELGRAVLIRRRRKRNADNFVPMIVAEDRGFDRQ